MKEKVKATPNVQLRRERELRGWSQKYVAEELNTNAFTVNRWENSNSFPSPHFRQKLCELFGKNAQELGLLPKDASDGNKQSLHQSLHDQELRSPDSEPFLHDPAIPPLSASPAGLVGRDELLHRLKQQLCAGKSLALSALNGLPGVGKTALAVELAHDPDVRAHFHDGVLWSGLGRKPNVLDLLSRWGALLGMASSQMAKLTSVEDWAIAIRATIGMRQMLLVIDDAWRIEEALVFKLGGVKCAHLVTTRLPEVALRFAGEGTTVVHELSVHEGLTLLERLAPEIVTHELGAAQTLVRLVGGLPLALTLMGNYLRVQAYSGQPRRLRGALERLHQAEERLRLEQPQAGLVRHPGLLAGTPLSLQAVIGISDEALDEAAQQALRALSLFPSKPNTFSEEAALAVSTVSTDTLDVLTDAGLLEGGGSGRYTLHQAIADYVRLRLNDATAQERMITFFVSYIETHEMDYDTLEQETSNVLAALQVAFERGMQALLVRGVNAFFHFLEIRGLYTVAEMHLKWAEQAARSLDEPMGLATALLNLGKIAEKRGDYEQAEIHLQEGLGLARQIGHHELIISLLRVLSIVATERGENERAEGYLQEGLSLARQSGYRETISALLRSLGRLAYKRGDYEQAEVHLQEGLGLARQIGHRELISDLLTRLGTVASYCGDYERAEGYYQESLALTRQIGHRELTSGLLTGSGSVAKFSGDYERAEGYYQEGLALARQIGHRELISLLLRILGWIATQRGDYRRAEGYLREGLELARQIGHRERMSSLFDSLGEMARLSGDYEQAEMYYQEGLELARQIGHRELITGLLTGLGGVVAQRGDYKRAEGYLQEGLELARQIGLPSLISTALSEWGELHLKQQQWAAAATAFHAALETTQGVSQERATAQYGLARVAAALGNTNKARREGQASLAIFMTKGHSKAAEIGKWLISLPVTSNDAEC